MRRMLKTLAESDAPGEPSLDAVLSAIENQSRREILAHLLNAGCARSVSEVAEAVDLDRFAASRHLSILTRAGLVTVSKQSTRRLHSIDLAGLADLDDWLFPFMRAFDAGTDAALDGAQRSAGALR